jgi:protein-disulfide reductase (glutathione)
MLKKTFRESGEKLIEASKKYIMVAVDGEENTDLAPEFTKEGGYIPRVMFLDSKATLQPEVINPAGHAQYKYFYTNANLVADTMNSFTSKKEDL